MFLLIVVTSLLAACGDGAEESPPTTPATTGEGSMEGVPPESADEDTSLEKVDWATVDLTTLDWDNLDVSQIDFEAIGDNPTVGDLDEETIARIIEVMPEQDSGNATLTIGDTVWEFDSFGCAFGHEATQSDVYSFSSNSFGEHEGARVQMQANIRDESGQGRFEGNDLNFDVDIDDIDNFENPSIAWQTASVDSFVIDGDSVTVSATFDDRLTEGEREEAPGTLEATCGSQSRR